MALLVLLPRGYFTFLGSEETSREPHKFKLLSTKKIASKWRPNCVHENFWGILKRAPQNYTRAGFHDLKFTQELQIR